MYNTDINVIFLVKTRTSHTCQMCRHNIPKGSYCLGKNYRWYTSKTCLNCAENYLNNFMRSLEDYKKIAKKELDTLNKNKIDYETTNNLARI